MAKLLGCLGVLLIVAILPAIKFSAVCISLDLVIISEFCALVAVVLMVSSIATATSGWDTFIIRENSTEGAPTIQSNDDYVMGATEFVIGYSSQKAGWGTNAANGATVGDLSSISIDRLDDPLDDRDLSAGGKVAPYFNIWVTDGGGNYAVIANEPSNGEWQPGNNQWDIGSWA